MPLFIEHLLEMENRWAIQVMQHALSLLSHVPLRLLDRKKIFRNLPNNWMPHTSLESDLFFTSVPDEVVDYCNNRQNTPWFTRPSNIHPLVESLRKNRKWLTWEHFLIGTWLRFPQDEEIVITNYFHHAMQVAAFRLEIPNIFDGYLVVGPSFIPPGDNSDETFWYSCVLPFVKKINKALSPIAPMFKYDRDELNLLGTSRGWIKGEHLKQKTKMLGNTVRTLFLLEQRLSAGTNLQRCTYNQLAQTSFLINRSDIIDITEKLKEIADHKLTLHLDLVQRLKEAEWPLVVEYFQGNLGLIKEDPKAMPSGKKVWIPDLNALNETAQISAKKLLSIFEDLWRDLGVAYGTLHYGYAKDSLTRFENWLNNEFGLVSATEPGDPNQPISKNMYFRIAREVTYLFTADTTTIYVYNYPHKELEHKITYYQEKLAQHERNIRRQALKSLMEEARANPNLRKRSISYRCADHKQSHFCRAWNRDPNLIDPRGEDILNLSDSTTIRSAFAVPMVVNRRLFGVLEIGGYSHHQFRFANLTLAQDIGHVLGTFLYQKEFLATLNHLSQTILDHELDDKAKYKVICREFTGLIGADGTVLYLPQGRRQDEYYLAEWWNRPDLDKFSEKELAKCNLTKGQSGSALMEAFQSTEPYIITNIKDVEKRNIHWRRQLPQRRALPDLFDWQVAIPVRDPRGVSRNLCGLYVYYKSHVEKEVDIEPLSKRWKPTVEFMAHYVALLLMAMQSRREQDEKLKNILRHELKQTVESVAQRAHDMLRFLRHYTQNISKYLTREEIMKGINTKVGIIYKDLSASQKVLSYIAEILEAESFRNLMESGLDPILYLISQKGEVDLKEAAEEIYLRDDLFTVIRKVWEKKEEYMVKELEYNFAGLPPSCVIKANKTLIRRLFENLFINALKYSIPKSEIKVEIEKKKRSLIVHLINDAISLAHGEENSIFEYEFRGTNAKNIKGDGLGLTVAQRLCEVLDAGLTFDIRVLNEKEGISRFDFAVALPLTIVPGKEPAAN